MSGDIEETNYIKLWRYIAPHLRKSLQTVYLREMTTAQWESMQAAGEVSAGKFDSGFILWSDVRRI